LDENIKKNIISRGEFDSKITELDKKFDEDDENENENDNIEKTRN
jgi:hypothetical protein